MKAPDLRGIVIDMNSKKKTLSKWDDLWVGGFYRVTESGQFVECDEKAREIFGIPLEETDLSKYSIPDLYVEPGERDLLIKNVLANKGAVMPGVILHLKINGVEKFLFDVTKYDESVPDNGKCVGIIAEISSFQNATANELIWKKFEYVVSGMDDVVQKFLHPLLKSAGSAEVLYQMSDLLQVTIKQGIPDVPDTRELGRGFWEKLIEVRDNLPDIDEPLEYSPKNRSESLELARIVELKKELTKTIHGLEDSLRTVTNRALLHGRIRESALSVLEQLKRFDALESARLKMLFKEDFIEYLQVVLLYYMRQIAKNLRSETQILNKELEGFRPYVGKKQPRRPAFAKYDIRRILDKNLALFEPVFATKNIGIESKMKGTLTADISRNDVERIISHLFNNALHYSYEGESRFVTMHAKELQPQNVVEISIQNLGVPIKKDEIDSEAVFRYGFRGELANRHYLEGIGGGLTDVKDVVVAHRGKVVIKSEPIKNDGDPPQYKVPYKTTVTITIPRKREGNSK